MFDNLRPLDYPKFEPAEFLGDKYILVKDGDFIVDRSGDLLEVTKGNHKYSISDLEYDKTINVHYLRAKYLGNRDDSLENANWIRLAKPEETQKVQEWLESGVRYKVADNGQLTFV